MRNAPTVWQNQWHINEFLETELDDYYTNEDVTLIDVMARYLTGEEIDEDDEYWLNETIYPYTSTGIDKYEAVKACYTAITIKLLSSAYVSHVERLFPTHHEQKDTSVVSM